MKSRKDMRIALLGELLDNVLLMDELVRFEGPDATDYLFLRKQLSSGLRQLKVGDIREGYPIEWISQTYVRLVEMTNEILEDE